MHDSPDQPEDEYAPRCTEEPHEDQNNVCNQWTHEVPDDNFHEDRDDRDTFNEEENFDCNEPEWKDDDRKCDDWGNPHDGSATSNPDLDEYPEHEERPNHPVKEALNFKWFDGSYSASVPSGPMVCINMNEGGGHYEVTSHSEEYAEYIMRLGDPIWDHYSSEEEVEKQIEVHLMPKLIPGMDDDIACISVWENTFGSNDHRPDWYDETEETWDDPDG